MEQQILEKLKNLRLEKGYKPMVVADYLGIDESAYNKLESGKSQTWGKYFIQLLEFYQIHPSDFFKDMEGKNFVLHQENKDQSIGQMNGGTINYSDKPMVKHSLAKSDKIIALQEEQLKEKDRTIALLGDKLAHLEAELRKTSKS